MTLERKSLTRIFKKICFWQNVIFFIFLSNILTDDVTKSGETIETSLINFPNFKSSSSK